MTDEAWLRRRLSELNPAPPVRIVGPGGGVIELPDNGRDAPVMVQRPPNDREAVPARDLASPLRACLAAGRCAVCGTPFAAPGAAWARAVYQGRPLCLPCALGCGDPARPRVFTGWRPESRADLQCLFDDPRE